MDAHKLVKMVNEIAAFFEAEADRNVALEGVAGHLKRFWDPRMRREIVRHVDEHGGELKERRWKRSARIGRSWFRRKSDGS